ncbi:hypothetical protein FRC10_003990 [Ceratobasidium sp. 414]|nr:hypothetical protein FRC10_003990 [Ceratobasidium sp. 414]
MLETQHWLELTDGHAVTVKFYHRKWQEEDTEENFFMWLDRGGGKDLSLPECSREQLEKERVIRTYTPRSYMSKEQRANYLVKIDEKVGARSTMVRGHSNSPPGRGCSAGLGTTSTSTQEVTGGKMRASISTPSIPLLVVDAGTGNGQGIVPMTPEEMHGAEPSEMPPKHGKIGFINTGEEHYTETAAKPGDSKMMRTFRNRFTPQGIMEHMKRNLFIGIKDTGTFQHSSFTAGGLISSAGLITVKSGRIHKLSPLSGHYRTPAQDAQHFRLFLDDLSKQGADLSKVQATKTEMTLWGLEHYKRFKKVKKAMQKIFANTVNNTVSPKPKHGQTQSDRSETRTSSDSGRYEKKLEKDAKWVNDGQWRREILCGRRNTTGAQPVRSQGNDDDIRVEQTGGG